MISDYNFTGQLPIPSCCEWPIKPLLRPSSSMRELHHTAQVSIPPSIGRSLSPKPLSSPKQRSPPHAIGTSTTSDLAFWGRDLKHLELTDLGKMNNGRHESTICDYWSY
ncbi:hypothetical protein PGT21_026287 [Puccinia graminis f. sp. tritici]|uniref:Uncharacterized protein n=1 Tax=Puccinia graminis f. sp. tritici TaxID=56615 RepID=A0A5B0NAQ2_PUCGR|nr:hypothetical protein PGT21_026287 [Puccinia graminis f. sp. tritici]KAA1086271.1 hypothetical protein PGTUg99_017703 [Puccinia graminis f. sp. tritici]